MWQWHCARFVKDGAAIDIVDRFLTTAFAHGRHDQRVAKIAAMEKEEGRAGK
jgi:ribose 5-phosphate isomerase RpiB